MIVDIVSQHVHQSPKNKERSRRALPACKSSFYDTLTIKDALLAMPNSPIPEEKV